MRGGHDSVSREELARLPDVIEELGYTLMSRHQTQEGIVEQENKLDPVDIHDRDYQWLRDADVGIFEITNPSLGVGAEIADMIHEGKPILLLYQGDEQGLSAYIRGKATSTAFVNVPVECERWGVLSDDARAIISVFVEEWVLGREDP